MKIFILLALFLSTQAIAAPKPKLTICHFDQDEGSWVTITISEAAVQAHLRNHDDAFVGGVTSASGTQLDANCQAADAPVEEPES